jgi:hypothetical protein
MSGIGSMNYGNAIANQERRNSNNTKQEQSSAGTLTKSAINPVTRLRLHK